MIYYRPNLIVATLALFSLIGLVFPPSLLQAQGSGTSGWLTIDNPVSVHSVTNGTLDIDGRAGGMHVFLDECDQDPIRYFWERTRLESPVSYTITNETTGSLESSGDFPLTQTAGGAVNDVYCGNNGEGDDFRYTFDFQVDVSTLSPGLYRLTATTIDDIVARFVTDSFLFEIGTPQEPVPAIQASLQNIGITYEDSNTQLYISYQVKSAGQVGSSMDCVVSSLESWINVDLSRQCIGITSGDFVSNTVTIDAQQTSFGTNTGSIRHDCLNSDFSGPGCTNPSVSVPVNFDIDLVVDLQAQ